MRHLIFILLAFHVAPGLHAEASEADVRVRKAELERALAGTSPQDQLAAVTALAAVDHPKAVAALLELLARPFPGLGDVEKEMAAAEKDHATAYARVLADVRQRGNNTVAANLAADLDKAAARIADLERRLLVADQLAPAIEEGFGKMTSLAAQEEIVRAAGEHASWRARAACVRALGKIGGTVAEAGVLAAASDETTLVRVAAAVALGNPSFADGLAALDALLHDPGWQVRAEAIRSLRQLQRRDAAPLMIAALEREAGRLREDLGEALTELTGMKLPPEADEWRSWWEARGAAWLASQEGAPGEDVAVVEEPDDTSVTFYGIRTKSLRLLFIVDVSGSMNEPAGLEEEDPKGGGQAEVTGTDAEKAAAKKKSLELPPLPANPTKLDVAKHELARAIVGLEENAFFNVIVYSEDCRLFEAKKMIPATTSGKERALAEIRTLRPLSGTNIHDALRMGFDLARGRDKKGALAEGGIDTIFFLSDGKPTVGKLTKTDEILVAVNAWNHDLGIKVHSIGVGTEHDETFMRALAEAHHGAYVGHK